MLETTQSSGIDREQPRKTKRNGNYRVDGSFNEKLRNGREKHM